MAEASQRNLNGWDFFLLWSGAAIALTEIWAGSLLLPLGLVAGLAAILLGHLIGNLPLGLAGLIGSRHGVPAMVGTRGALGVRGSHVAAAINVVQLVGWTGVMLWIAGDAAAKLVPALAPSTWMVICGVLTTLWTLGGHRLWKPLQRVSVALLFALTLWMTWVVLQNYSLSELLRIPRKPDLPFMIGVDIVIAMPISWLPLVSDYTRFARTSRGAFWGTFVGYFLASCWMYAVGVVAGLATGSSTPDAAVMQLMAAQKLGMAALLIVLLSTFTTTFLDIYSTSVSAQSMRPKLREKPVTIVVGILGTLIALVFSPLQYEGFLLFIGSAFCPLFGIVLTDYLAINRSHYDGAALSDRHGRHWHVAGFNPRGFLAWSAGILTYLFCAAPSPLFPWGQSFALGASLPGMIVPALIYLALMKGSPRGTTAGEKP